MQGLELIFAAILLCFGALLNALVVVYLAARTVLAYTGRAERKKASALIALASMHN